MYIAERHYDTFRSSLLLRDSSNTAYSYPPYRWSPIGALTISRQRIGLRWAIAIAMAVLLVEPRGAGLGACQSRLESRRTHSNSIERLFARMQTLLPFFPPSPSSSPSSSSSFQSLAGKYFSSSSSSNPSSSLHCSSHSSSSSSLALSDVLCQALKSKRQQRIQALHPPSFLLPARSLPLPPVVTKESFHSR